MSKRKEFSKLNLLDRFLFDEAMEDSENMKTVLDSNLLPPGSVDFNKLNRAFIILIMPFDPFGKGFYKYTFRMKCEECPDLDLQDDVTRIFLNCHGTHPEMVSPELIELLHYMEKSTNEVAGSCTSQKIKLLHQKVCQIRSNKKMEGEVHARVGRKRNRTAKGIC